MKIPIYYKPEVCADSKGKENAVTTHLHLGAGGALCATDGKIVFVLMTSETQNDVGGPIPVEAIRMARKLADLDDAPEIELVCHANEIRVMRNGNIAVTVARPRVEGKFPDWKAMQSATEQKLLGSDFGSPAFAVNEPSLAKARRALGSKSIILKNTPEDAPILVTCPGREIGKCFIIKADVNAPAEGSEGKKKKGKKGDATKPFDSMNLPAESARVEIKVVKAKEPKVKAGRTTKLRRI